MTSPTLPQEIINAFHLMWGMFPEPVMLIHKSREVMALNDVAKSLGYIQPGMKCNKVGLPKHIKVVLQTRRSRNTGQFTALPCKATRRSSVIGCRLRSTLTFMFIWRSDH